MSVIKPVSFGNTNSMQAPNPFMDSFKTNFIISNAPTAVQAQPAAVPQSAPVIQTPVVQQPIPAVQAQDEFIKSETVQNNPEKSTSKVKKALPYIVSGVALAATVVMGVLFKKGQTKLAGAEDLGKQLQSQVARLTTENGTLNEQIAGLSSQLANAFGAKGFIDEVVPVINEAVDKGASKLNIKDIVLPLITGIAGIFGGAAAPSLIDKIKGAEPEKPFIVVAREGEYVDDGRHKTISIWDDKSLNLNSAAKIDSNVSLKEGEIGPVARKIQNEIGRIVNGESKPTPMKDPKIWSVSYEGLGYAVGGQADIAKELPVALQNEGADVLSVAPLVSMDCEADGIKYGIKKDGEKLFYVAPQMKQGIEVQKLYEGKLDDGSLFEAYYAPKGPHGAPVLYLTDNNYLDMGNTVTNNVYQNTAKSNERVRMAQFNNLLYEAAIQAKEGKLVIPGAEKSVPDKVVAHEAWQSAGFLMKARLLSHALEADGKLNSDSAEYIRGLADNTAVITHNIGPGYQGYQGEKDINEAYFNTIYGDYAHDMVYYSCVPEDTDDRILGLSSTESQRLGFYAKDFRPAHAAVLLATKIGPVSEGYVSEIINDGLAGDLTRVIQTRKKKGGLVPFPNGVDKKSLAATAENVKSINDVLDKYGITERVVPYIENYNDDAKTIDIQELIQKRDNNNNIFTTLLKSQLDPNSTVKPFGEKAEFYKGEHGLNLEGISPKTKIYSMASRLDSQKGFDTAVDAYKLLVSKYKGPKEDTPVLILSGAGNAELEKYIKDKKDEMGKDGTRLLYTAARVPNETLLLMNMATTGLMPSDFEPYGISDVKVMYAGSHIINTEVGGMKAEGNVSRKIYSLKNDGVEKANAITIDDYEYICSLPSNVNKEKIKNNNAKRLFKAMSEDCRLTREDSAKLDRNALATDVSWNKGAVQNYCEQMGIEITKAA